MNETEIKTIIADTLAEYDKQREEREKQRIENYLTTKTKNFVVKNFTTIVICVLLFWCFGGGTAVKNYAAGWFARMFNVQINNAVIQRIIPNNSDREGFIDRIKKLFDRDYANEVQFESHYKQLTADYWRKYPALLGIAIKSKEELAAFAEIKIVPVKSRDYTPDDSPPVYIPPEPIAAVKQETEQTKETTTTAPYCPSGNCGTGTTYTRRGWR
ncbi:hypothetical protein FACS1894214_4670 [Planctomycetales bacterium]|nr:hypothetical protein FACS1894214_4670 [Planctomycetales bacterium]